MQLARVYLLTLVSVIQKMVHQLDYRWNQVYASLMLMHQRLAELGLEELFEEL